MKNICDIDNHLSKIFRSKLSKMLFCLFISSDLFLLEIMVMTNQYNLEFFLICSFLLLLGFIFIYIIFFASKIIDRKNNGVLSKNLARVYKCIKSKVKRDYQKDLTRFHNKWELILYYSGQWLWIFCYIVFFKWKFMYQIIYWCTYLLFCFTYRLTLHIIYEKSDKGCGKK